MIYRLINWVVFGIACKEAGSIDLLIWPRDAGPDRSTATAFMRWRGEFLEADGSCHVQF